MLEPPSHPGSPKLPGVELAHRLGGGSEARRRRPVVDDAGGQVALPSPPHGAAVSSGRRCPYPRHRPGAGRTLRCDPPGQPLPPPTGGDLGEMGRQTLCPPRPGSPAHLHHAVCPSQTGAGMGSRPLNFVGRRGVACNGMWPPPPCGGGGSRP